jgi:hypothetical protein
MFNKSLADFFELNTYELFMRAGVEVLPISYGLWVVDKEICVQNIVKNLGLNQRGLLLGY